MAQVLKWSFVPLLFFGMLVSFFSSFEHLTLSMMMIVRNLTPLVTLPGGMAVMPADKQPTFSRRMIMSLMICLQVRSWMEVRCFCPGSAWPAHFSTWFLRLPIALLSASSSRAHAMTIN